MPTLVSFDTIKERLSLQDDEGVSIAVARAIKATNPYLESVLRTKLTAGSSVDTFFIDNQRLSLDSLFLLRLRNGFVAADSLHVFVASTIDAIASASALEWSQVFVTEDSLERGFVRIPESVGREWGYVRVEYDYGFRDEDVVPSWLSEAATAYAIQLMANQQIGDGKAELSEAFKFLSGHCSSILDAHLRTSSIAIGPLY